MGAPELVISTLLAVCLRLLFRCDSTACVYVCMCVLCLIVQSRASGPNQHRCRCRTSCCVVSLRLFPPAYNAMTTTTTTTTSTTTTVAAESMTLFGDRAPTMTADAGRLCCRRVALPASCRCAVVFSRLSVRLSATLDEQNVGQLCGCRERRMQLLLSGLTTITNCFFSGLQQSTYFSFCRMINDNFFGSVELYCFSSTEINMEQHK